MADESKTGTLVYAGQRKLGLELLHWFECIDCKTLYPQIDGTTHCNGKSIAFCPWCRPDSEPWKHGRGE